MSNFRMSEWLREGGNRALKKFSLNQSYVQNGWVFSCVDAISKAVSSVPLKFRDKNDKETGIKDPLYLLFNPPKSQEIPSFGELMKRTSLLYELHGGCYWVLIKKNGVIKDVALKFLYQLEKVKNSAGEHIGWVERDKYNRVVNSVVKGLVIEFSQFNPINTEDKMTSLYPARLDVEQDFNMSAWNANMFSSSFKKDLILETEKALTGEQRKEFLQGLLGGDGGIRDAHGVTLLTHGVISKDNTTKQKESDFTESRNLTREAICAIWGVPPAVVGIYRYANYANSKEQKKIFWENTITPKQVYYKSIIQTQILDVHFPGSICEWDYRKISALRMDPKDLATTAKIYQDMGYSYNEIANILNSDELKKEGENPKTLGPSAGSTEEASIEVVSSKSWWAEYSAAYEVYSKGREKRWVEAYSGFVNALGDSVLRKTKLGMNPSLVLEEYLSYWKEASLGLVTRDWESGAQVFFEEERNFQKGLGPRFNLVKAVNLRDVMTEFQYDAFNRGIKEYLQRVQGIGKNVIQEINNLVTSSLSQGMSIDSLRQLLEKQLQISVGKALSIARTASGGGYNNSRYALMQLRGVKKHRWVNAGDSLVRPSHVLENTHEVEIGTLFPVTKLLHPHDPNGAFKEIVNCRCTAVATVMGSPSGRTRVPSNELLKAGIIKEAFDEILARVKRQSSKIFGNVGFPEEVLNKMTLDELKGLDSYFDKEIKAADLGAKTNGPVEFVSNKWPKQETVKEFEDAVLLLRKKTDRGEVLTWSDLKGVGKWESATDVSNFLNGRVITVIEEIGKQLEKLGLIPIATDVKSNKSKFKYTLQVDRDLRIIRELQSGEEKKVSWRIHNQRLLEREGFYSLGSSSRVLISNSTFERTSIIKFCSKHRINPELIAVRKVIGNEFFGSGVVELLGTETLIDMPYFSASSGNIGINADVFLLFDLPEDSNWWSLNVGYVKGDNGNPFKMGNRKLWGNFREGEILLKGIWAVISSEQVDGVRVLVLRPISRNSLENLMIKTSGGYAMTFKIDNFIKPGYSVDFSLFEFSLLYKRRMWSEEHLEQAKKDYPGLNEFWLWEKLMNMYPNYKRRSDEEENLRDS